MRANIKRFQGLEKLDGGFVFNAVAAGFRSNEGWGRFVYAELIQFSGICFVKREQRNN